MNHLSKTFFKQIALKNFSLVSSDYIPSSATSDTIILKRNNTTIYHLSLNQYIKTSSIEITSFKEIHSFADVFQNQLVVLLEEDQIIGYIYWSDSFQKLFEYLQKEIIFNKVILDVIGVSCTVIDEQSNIKNWTYGAEKIFNLTPINVIGKPITNFFHEDSLEILKSLKNGTSVKNRRHEPAKNLVVSISSAPVVWQKQTIGAVVTEKKITQYVYSPNKIITKNSSTQSPKDLARQADSFSAIKGSSQALKDIISLTKKVASTRANILLNGESGVGKELFAKAIHKYTDEKGTPFIAINCGAIPDGLFESEIFGYAKGAFSGADTKGKKGKVELAKGGTLFLDEIGELPLNMQVKILRLLQEKTYYQVGGIVELASDFRLITATNRDLKKLVEEGKFREDLYYRLNVINLTIPSLQQRTGDIVELSHYFLSEISLQYNRKISSFPREIIQVFSRYSWPGNIRELKNIIERLVIFSENNKLNINHLPSDILLEKKNPPNKTDQTLSSQLEIHERRIILQALELADFNKNSCAKQLGITRATLYNRLKKLNITL